MSPSRVPLGDIADFVNGVAFKPDDWEESGKRILRIQNLTDSTKPFNRTNRAVAKKYEVSPGDLLVSWSATLGVFVWEGPDTALVNQHIFRVVPDHGRIDPCYLRHMLSDALVQMEQHLHGATMKHVNRREFLATTIPLPPLAEQKRLAGILDAADALRGKRREALAELDTLLQSTFLDMFGDPVTNPMGWVETPFGDITTDTKLGLVRSSKEFGWDFGIPYVRMDAVTGDGYFLPDKVQSTHADEEEVEVFALRPGDFLFNTRNSKELVGKVCVFPGPEGWLFNNNLMRVRFRADVEPWVIAMQFRFIRVQRELGKRKCGTTSVFAVYWKSLRTLPVLVPPLDLQHRFAAIVKFVEQQKASQRAHLDELDTLFASLQSRAFRGGL